MVDTNTEIGVTFKVMRVFIFHTNSSLHHRVQTGSEAHPASCTMGIRGSSLRGKPAGAWSWPLISI
jgi:hypothetical protein